MLRVVVPVRNAEPYIMDCLGSLKRQRYGDWRAVVVDDASDDRTYELAVAAAAGCPQIAVLQNSARQGAAANMIRGIAWHDPAPDDVIITLDGDDQLAGDRALCRVAQEYADPRVRITYGSHLRWGRKSPPPYPASVLRDRSYRSFPFRARHLRTFRFELWSKLDPASLIDPATGFFWESACDVAIMFPLLEMCLPEEIRHIADVLYLYNDENPLNNYKVDRRAQSERERRIRAAPPYPRRPP